MDDESTRELAAVGEETDTYPTLAGGVALADGPHSPPLADDADDEWPVRAPSGGVRLAYPIAALVAVVLIAGGFWGGAALEKGHASTTAGGGGGAAGLAARLRAALGATGASGATGATGASGASGASGFAGFGGFGGSSSAAVGTVSVVDGNTLYVLTSSGSLVKVELASTTTVSRNAKATATSLRPGDTVIVQGTTATNGDVTATSVSATAPGVTSAGGFGGGGRFSRSGSTGTGTGSSSG